MKFVLIFLSGMTSRNRVDLQILVRKHRFPDLVLDKGPSQFTNIQLKGSPNIEIGYRGADRIIGFGLATI